MKFIMFTGKKFHADIPFFFIYLVVAKFLWISDIHMPISISMSRYLSISINMKSVELTDTTNKHEMQNFFCLTL
jgi:hypothetical protein